MYSKLSFCFVFFFVASAAKILYLALFVEFKLFDEEQTVWPHIYQESYFGDDKEVYLCIIFIHG